MFKDIEKIINRKKSNIVKSKNKDTKLVELIKLFFKNEFGEDINNFKVKTIYNAKDNSIIIETGNKILANEVTIRLTNLFNLLKENNIKLTRVLIR